MKGRKSHAILQKGLQILVNLDHRGATGADATLGDGCGVLTQIPHGFFAHECERLGLKLPEPGHYAIGQFFMPRDAAARAEVEAIVEETVVAEGQIAHRLARHSRRQFGPRRAGEGGRAGSAANLHRPPPEHRRRRRFRAQAVHPAQGHLQSRLRGRRRAFGRILSRLAVVPHDRLQGHGAGSPARALLQGSARSALRDRARAGPSALRHQHVPVLAARPSLSHGRP